MQKFTILLLFIASINNLASAQVAKPEDEKLYQWEFYQYLKNNKLAKEALTWLQTYPHTSSDSALSDKLNTEIAFLFLHENLPDSAQKYFKKCNRVDQPEVLKAAMATCIRSKDTIALSNILVKSDKLLSHEEVLEYQYILKILQNRPITDTSYLTLSDTSLTQIIERYTKFDEKSALKAGLYAALIPGMGKKYLGFKSQALSSFVINSILLATVIESIKVGSSIINWYISIPVFTVFYIGNIWGSVQLAKKMTIDFKYQIHEDIFNHYWTHTQINMGWGAK